MNNLIPDIIKAIKKINDEKAYLKDELKKASTKDELNSLQKQFNDLSFNAQRVVLEDFKTVDLNALFSNDLKAFFDSIPKPKDGLNGKDGMNGLDAVVDYESLNKYLNDKVADIKIPEAEKVNYDLIKSTINELVNQFTSTIKNGKDGLNGIDGVGIQDIKDNKGYFEIILSNGNKKKINKPLDGINRHGGGFAVNGGSSVELIDNLESIDTLKALTANQGKILKDYIDSINVLIDSDDSTLDTVQEIVAYIKENKNILDNLDVDSISGLQTILNDKVDSNNVYSKIEVDNKQNLFIQDAIPTVSSGNKALWIDTSNGNITFNIVTGD